MAENRQRGQLRVATEGGPSVSIDTRTGSVPDDGSARLAATRARSFRELSGFFSDIADKAVAKEGAAQGRKMAMDGSFEPSRLPTIRSEAFDAAGLDIYRRKAQVEVRREIEALAETHGDDPAGLKVELAKSRQRWLETSFEELAPDIVTSFDQVAHAFERQAQDRYRARVISEQTAVFKEELASRLSSLERQAYATGNDPVSAQALGIEMAELEKSLEGTRVDGAPLMPAELRQAFVQEAEARVAMSRVAGVYDRLGTLQDREAFIGGLESEDALERLPEAVRDRVRSTLREAWAGQLRAETLAGLDAADDDEIERRLALAAPEDGSPLAEERGKIYDELARESAALRRRRFDDPAGSVASSEAVVAARRARTAGDPASQQAYVQALLDAQRAVGIQDPDYLPRDEAARMFGMVASAQEEQKGAKMRDLAIFIEGVFGGHADGVLRDVLRSSGINRAVVDAALPVVRSVSAGRMPRRADLDRVGVLSDVAASEQSVEIFGGARLASLDLPGAAPSNRMPPFSKADPSMEARLALVQRPGLASQFDEVHGPGSAAAVLGEEDAPVFLDDGGLGEHPFPGLGFEPTDIGFSLDPFDDAEAAAGEDAGAADEIVDGDDASGGQ